MLKRIETNQRINRDGALLRDRIREVLPTIRTAFEGKRDPFRRLVLKLRACCSRPRLS